jgi:hypothetical protein
MSDLDRVSETYLYKLLKRKQKRLIIEWFRARGIQPELDYDNHPIITNAMIKQALGGEENLINNKRKRGNRSALKEAMGIS